jgi:type I restriction enzyme S subunit
MNAELLLKHFDRIAEAPDAVSRLRRFVLDLAVRGKLVEQGPDDEPTSELVNRIEAVIGQPCPVPRGQGEELEFELPRSWEWTLLGALATKTGSGSTPRGGKAAYRPSGIAFLRSQNIHNDGLRLDDVAYIDAATHARMAGTAVQAGDLLLNITGGSIGRCCRVPDDPIEANVSQHVAIIRLALPEMRDYFHKVVLSPFFQSFVMKEQTGAGRGGLPKKRMDLIPVPLPPVCEQARIAARVDELMALCDELEAACNEREARRDRLVAASLHRLQTAPATADEAADADPPALPLPAAARFHLDHLPRLVTRAEHVKQLRQTILRLAIQGCLVPQHRGDEPVDLLLDRIRKYKASVAGGRGRTSCLRVQPAVTGPFLIPAAWRWVRLGEVMFSRDGERVPVSKDERRTRAKIFDYYGASGVIDKIDGYLFDKPLLLVGEDGANLINRSTPIAFIARGKYWVNNHAHVLDGVSEILLRYMELYINATDLKPYVTGTAQPKMNQAKMNSIPVALPPDPEQHRIVAKVDQLMALCDQLEAQLATTEANSRRLLEAVLRDALQPAQAQMEVA